MKKRVLLKISGESLAKDGKEGGGIDPDAVFDVAKKIKDIYDLGIETSVVIGGGNIFRWRRVRESGMERVPADTIGMISTVINGVALQDALERLEAPTRLMSSIEMPKVCEPYIIRRAIRHLEKGRIVIFAGGTGGPFFTTDSAAAIRASEIKADLIIKASNVDGVYDSDPNKNPKAKKFDEITFKEAIEKNLLVMDITAFTICRENKIPIIVVNFSDKDSIKKAILGEKVGTLVR